MDEQTTDGAPTPPKAAPTPTGAAPVRPAAPARTPIRLPSPLAVITVALGIFFIALTLLAVQVRNGRDPALGAGPIPATSALPVSTGGKAATNATQTKATQVVTKTSPVPP